MANGDKNRVLEGKGLIAAKCPNCGGILSLHKGGSVECEYCHTPFLLHDAYKGQGEQIQNYYELAYSAQEGNNANEGYKYFTKVLELNTRESLAWYGKGVTTLGRSTGYSINAEEAITCFKKALEYANAEEADKLRNTIGATTYYYASLIYNWFWKNSWIDQNSLKDIMTLYYFSEENSRFTLEQTKGILNILCYFRHYPGSPEKINSYTNKIREVEPKFRNPIEARKRSNTITTLVTVGIVAGFVLLCILISVLTSR